MAEVRQQCPICTGPAEVHDHGALNVRCVSCGNFGVAYPCLGEDRLISDSGGARFKLSCVMAERWLKRGVTTVFITSTKQEGTAIGRTLLSVDELLCEFPKTPTEYFDRAILNLGRYVAHPSASITATVHIGRLMFSDEVTMGSMFEQLVDSAFVKVGARGYFITGKGWERIAKLNAPGRDARQAFVAMWFDPSRDVYFEKGIKPAVEADKLVSALRIDNKQHNGKVDDEIIAEIRRSRFLVADFTGDRGGIYFEAGFALGLGLPVIWCVDESEEDKLHFDTRQYNHIIYSSPEDLREQLFNRIRATIELASLPSMTLPLRVVNS
jgi:nucleoside 2-deoxyribosyltransferase